jgi:hypothetical protein
MTNFIELYVDVVDANRKAAEEMVSQNKVLTTYSNLVCRKYLNKATGYETRHVQGMTHEVKFKGEKIKIRRCCYDCRPRAEGGGVRFWCTCEVPRLKAVPCKHLLAVWLAGATSGSYTAERFLETFATLIPAYYLVKNYARRYSQPIYKPNLTYLLSDDTLPPAGTVRADRSRKRKPGLAERNSQPLPQKYKKRQDLQKTQKNVAENNLEKTLGLEAAKPQRSLRSRVSEFANMLFGSLVGNEEEEYPMPQHED